MKNKLLRYLCMALMAVVCMSVNAQAATSGTCGANATWEYDEGETTLTISGTGAMDNYTDALTDAPWNAYRTSVSKVVIGDGITHIGNWAFMGFTQLTSVTIGEDVESIGHEAFDNCTNAGFTKLNIPNSVKTIGMFAFSNNHLKYVCLGSGVTSIGREAFCACQDLEYIGSYALTPPTLGMEVFSAVPNLKAIYVDGYCRSEYAGAEGWSDFSEIIQTPYGYCGAGDGDEPTDAVSWGYSLMDRTLSFSGSGAIKDFSTMGGPNAYPWNNPAFNPKGGEYDMYWTGIEKIQMNKNITTIPDWAFAMQINCSSISLPSKLTSIGASALEECAFTSIDLPEGLETIGEYGFLGSKLTSVLFPSTLTSIGADAFLDNDDLAIITSARVTPPACADGAFGDGSTITAIFVPEGCTATYKAADGWKDYEAKIQEVPTTTFTYTATEKVAKFDDNLDRFQGAISVKSHEFDGTNGTVVYEGYVTGLGELALSYAKMTSITIPASVTSIGSGAFQSSKLTTVTLAGTTALKTIGARAFSSCSALTAFTVPATVTNIGASAFSGCSELATFTFEGTPTITSIGNAAFQECTKLTAFTIPESVTTLGTTVFWYTGLTSLNIPAGVTSIGQALYCASPVTSLTVDAGNTKYEDRGCNGIFEKGKNKLIAGGATTTIPDGITTIGQEAFWGEEGEFSLFLPESVTTIENRAFHMASGLTSLTIPSGVTYIDEECFAFCNGMQDVYCYVDAAAMTWDGGIGGTGMPAFIMNPAKSTKFHVTDADAWSTKFPDANVTFVGDLVATRPATHAVEKGGVTANWSTYYNSTQDVVADANTEVYQVSLTGTALTLTKVDDRIINAGQGVVLKSTDANIVLLTSDTQSATSYATNSLTGTDTQITNPGNAYALGYANSILGFYKLSAGGTIKAHKAYLIYAGGAPEFFDLDGNVTGIKAIDNGQLTIDNAVYDLQGRRVSKPTKGLYIVNGKKVVIK